MIAFDGYCMIWYAKDNTRLDEAIQETRQGQTISGKSRKNNGKKRRPQYKKRKSQDMIRQDKKKKTQPQPQDKDKDKVKDKTRSEQDKTTKQG